MILRHSDLKETARAVEEVNAIKSLKINDIAIEDKRSAVTLFRYSSDYIAKLLDDSGFVLLKSLEFLAFKYLAENKDIFFKAYVVQNISLRI